MEFSGHLHFLTSKDVPSDFLIPARNPARNEKLLNVVLNSRLSNSSFSKMPCCCATNVQAAFVLGIINIVLNLGLCLDYVLNYVLSEHRLDTTGSERKSCEESTSF